MLSGVKEFFGFGKEVAKVVEAERDPDKMEHRDYIKEERREDKQEKELIELADDLIFKLDGSKLSKRELKKKVRYEEYRLDLGIK